MATTLRTSGITMGSSTMDVGGSSVSVPARFWISFNGVNMTVWGSLGVSSVSKNSTGSYRINHPVELPNSFARAYTCCVNSQARVGNCAGGANRFISEARVYDFAGNLQDNGEIMVSCIAN